MHRSWPFGSLLKQTYWPLFQGFWFVRHPEIWIINISVDLNVSGLGIMLEEPWAKGTVSVRPKRILQVTQRKIDCLWASPSPAVSSLWGGTPVPPSLDGTQSVLLYKPETWGFSYYCSSPPSTLPHPVLPQVLWTLSPRCSTKLSTSVPSTTALAPTTILSINDYDCLPVWVSASTPTQLWSILDTTSPAIYPKHNLVMSPPIPQSFQRLPTALRQTEILNLAYEAPQGVACAPQLQLLHSALCSLCLSHIFQSCLLFQTSSHHRIFAQAIPSVCSALFPFLCLDIL